MTKLRTISWFLLLLILLVTLVSFTLAQETPTAAEGQLFQRDSSQVQPGDDLVKSTEEMQIELSTVSRHSQAFPPAEIALLPKRGGDASPNSTGRAGNSITKFLGDLSDTPTPKTFSPGEPEPIASSGRYLDFAGRYVGLPQSNPSPSALGDTCTQLLGNTELNVSDNSAAPWVEFIPEVYFSNTEYFQSAPYSLLVEDNDVGDDDSPTIDAFDQVIHVPTNLTSITIRYGTKTLNSSDEDYPRGFLWPVDKDGYLIGDEPVFDWQVLPSPGSWTGRFVEITDEAVLQKLQGKDIDVIFFNSTDASPPNEVVFFDDITFDACQPDAPNSYITVKKETDPDGASQNFTFAPSWGSNFQLADGDSKTSQALPPGTYSVEELPQSGWKQDSVTCSDGSDHKNISLAKGEAVTCTFRNVQEKTEDICRQVLVNTKLDIDEFGDGTGSAEPWSIIIPRVYYTNVEGRAYDGYSLVLKDGDDDPSPDTDMFAQGFLMPGNLTEVVVEYQRATVNTNASDEAHGELWLLDDDWVLHLGEPDKYFVATWEVAESDGAWAKQIITADSPDILNKLAGKKVAILLFNITDNAGAKEEVLFDNISLTACSQSAPGNRKVYMPSIMQKFGKPSGPICTPPNENPADQFHSNRGLVQTGATCNSTLSNIDKRDYYTFTPTTSGNHTLRLSNLPAGTEWAATIWLDTAKPTYAPGNSKAGICLTDQQGSGDKQVVCNLNKGTGYFVRIDSGSTPQAGSYTMRVTAP